MTTPVNRCPWGEHKWSKDPHKCESCKDCGVKSRRCRYGHDHTDEWDLEDANPPNYKRLDFDF
jgi:hypothetical protein